MVIFPLMKMFNPNDSASIMKIKEALLMFKCTKDIEVQRFLHSDAIHYELTHRARTYICSSDNMMEILGYFTIAIRDLEIKKTVAKSLKKRLTYGMTDVNNIPAYLIGQIAKSDICVDKIGKSMIDASLEYIKRSREYVGGRIVYLDCKEELVNYYENFGFSYLQDNKELKQMVQII